MFEVTKDMLKNANTYMPVEMKMILSKQIANMCVVDTATDKENGFSVKVEDSMMKNVQCLLVLVDYYLKADVKDKISENNAFEIHNEIACGNPVNQMERFKFDSDTKRIAFDILSDYREFKKAVNTEVMNLLTVYNDPYVKLSKLLLSVLENTNLREAMEKIAPESNDAKEVVEKVDET